MSPIREPGCLVRAGAQSVLIGVVAMPPANTAAIAPGKIVVIYGAGLDRLTDSESAGQRSAE
jgi:hypothetical protein